jgi:hypothetical protein
VAAVERIPKHPLVDPEMVETARAAVRGLLGGDVPVVEDGGEV